MGIDEKHLWTLTDLAKFYGTSVAYISTVYKQHPERLPKPIPHPIGKKDRWLKEDVISFCKNKPVADSIPQSV